MEIGARFGRVFEVCYIHFFFIHNFLPFRCAVMSSGARFKMTLELRLCERSCYGECDIRERAAREGQPISWPSPWRG